MFCESEGTGKNLRVAEGEEKLSVQPRPRHDQQTIDCFWFEPVASDADAAAGLVHVEVDLLLSLSLLRIYR